MPLTPVFSDFLAALEGNDAPPLDWRETTRNDPALFFKIVLRIPTWIDTYGRPRQLRKWQTELLEEIRLRLARGERRIKIHVRSCWGIGKDWLIAGLSIWWTSTREDARGLTMAQNKTGVRNLLWPNIARHYSNSILPGLGIGKLSQTRLVYRQDGVLGEPIWYLAGGWGEDASTLEGHHSPTAAIRVIDEAAGVEDQFFRKTQGLLDAPEVLDIYIGTPALRAGDFYERDLNGGENVIRVHVTKDDLIADGIPGQREATADLDQELKRVDYQLWNARRNGEYMEQLEGSLFPLEWINRAMKQTFEIAGDIAMATDVAGSEHGDETANYIGTGPDEEGRYQVRYDERALEAWSWRERDTMASKDRCLGILRRVGAKRWTIDANMLGKGMFDQAVRDVAGKGVTMIAYVSQEAPLDKTRFDSRKAEDAWFFRDLLEHELIRLPDSIVLRQQLAGYSDERTAKGKHKLVDPKPSPDHGDTVLMLIGGGRAPLPSNRVTQESLDQIEDLPGVGSGGLPDFS
jgi:hypothetical protein